MEYENYKRKSGYFDIQDLTNFLIRQVLIEFNDIKLIDYIFIDEIQDLTVSQIFLLILVSKYCKIYAGDTCQTISKINRFRFSELNNIFYNFQKVLPDFDSVVSANLTLNYRLNSKIMNLSTYMAYFMKECFPNTLDKFQDDFSIKITEHKPMLVNNIKTLFDIFNDENVNLVKNLTLSSLHCFICRDKIIKKELNRYNVMPRTIEESKGLEYDIVIVYNFFSSSPFYSLWDKLFREENLTESNDEFKSIITNLKNILAKENLKQLVNSLGLDKFYTNDSEERIKDKIINELRCMKYPFLKSEFDIHTNFDFCSELKQFYVIITRPRTFLLFYEERNCQNFSFFNRMINNGIIKDLSQNRNNRNYIDEIIDYYEVNNMLCKNKKEMKKFGDRKFIEERYEDAAYFYGKAGEENYQKKAKIYLNYKILKEEKRNHKLSWAELKELNCEIINYINDLKNLKKRIFEDVDNIEAFCYLNLEEYEKAIKLYIGKFMYNEVGEINFDKIHDYEKAFKYYKKGWNIPKAIKSLEKSEEKGHFIRLFEYLNNRNICINLGLSEYYNNYKKYISNLFINCYSKKRYIRNIFNKNKDEQNVIIDNDNDNEKEEELKDEENEDKNNKEENNNNENNKNIKDDKNDKKDIIIIKNDNLEKEKEKDNKNKKKKKSRKRRRIYQKRRKINDLQSKIEEEMDESDEEEKENEEDEKDEEENTKEENKEEKDENKIVENKIMKIIK